MKTSELRKFYIALTTDQKKSFRKEFLKQTSLEIQTLYGYLRSSYCLNKDRDIQPLVAEKIIDIANKLNVGADFGH